MIRTRFGSPVAIVAGSRDVGRAIVRRDDGREFDVSLVELREDVRGEIESKLCESWVKPYPRRYVPMPTDPVGAEKARKHSRT
jgi:hypothetical protein